MTTNINNLPQHLQDDYRDLCILRDRLAGCTVKEIALLWGCTVRVANNRIKAAAAEMMREVFKATQGDPDHPASPRWTIEEFTADPRACLVLMTTYHIDKLRETYSALKGGKR